MLLVWCAYVALVKFARFYAKLKKDNVLNAGLTTPEVKLELNYKAIVESLGLMTILFASLYIIRSNR
ncbi:MAG: hypothetical protein CTY10_06350 [Methylotenera sp.]|nr:MAG: hypothetical protein CTY10_06350 [Methylotenera sp.]